MRCSLNAAVQDVTVAASPDGPSPAPSRHVAFRFETRGQPQPSAHVETKKPDGRQSLRAHVAMIIEHVCVLQEFGFENRNQLESLSLVWLCVLFQLLYLHVLVFFMSKGALVAESAPFFCFVSGTLGGRQQSQEEFVQFLCMNL